MADTILGRLVDKPTDIEDLRQMVLSIERVYNVEITCKECHKTRTYRVSFPDLRNQMAALKDLKAIEREQELGRPLTDQEVRDYVRARIGEMTDGELAALLASG